MLLACKFGFVLPFLGSSLELECRDACFPSARIVVRWLSCNIRVILHLVVSAMYEHNRAYSWFLLSRLCIPAELHGANSMHAGWAIAWQVQGVGG